jgi:hypothetical protein
MVSERHDSNAIPLRPGAFDLAVGGYIEAVALAEKVAQGAIRAVTENDLRSGSPAAAVVAVMADGVDGLDESALHDEAVVAALGDLATACDAAMAIWPENEPR